MKQQSEKIQSQDVLSFIDKWDKAVSQCIEIIEKTITQWIIWIGDTLWKSLVYGWNMLRHWMPFIPDIRLMEMFPKWHRLYMEMAQTDELFHYKRVSMGDAYWVVLIKLMQPVVFPSWPHACNIFIALFAFSKMAKVGIFLRTFLFMYLWSTRPFRYFVISFLTFENYMVSTMTKRTLFQITLIMIIFLSDESLMMLRTVFSGICFFCLGLFLLYTRLRCQFINYRFLGLHVETPLSWDGIEDYMIGQIHKFELSATKIVFPKNIPFMSKNYPFISPGGYYAHSMSTLPEPKPTGLVENLKATVINPHFISSMVTSMIAGSLLFVKLFVLYGGQYTAVQLALEQTSAFLEVARAAGPELPGVDQLIEHLEERKQHYQKLLKQTSPYLIPLIEFLQTTRLRELFFK